MLDKSSLFIFLIFMYKYKYGCKFNKIMIMIIMITHDNDNAADNANSTRAAMQEGDCTTEDRLCK